MDRRGFLLSASAAALAKPAFADGLPVPHGDGIAFRIFRNGSPVGEHRLSFTRNGDDLAVAINIRAVVRIAGIPVYGYTATGVERWSNGVFQSLETKVDDGGRKREVHAQRIANGIQVEGTVVPRYVAPPNTLALTYWNKAMLDGPILNVETAHTDVVTIKARGWNQLPTDNDGLITAQRYQISGKLRFNVWYDALGQWSGLEMHIRGHETYEKIV